MRSLILLTYFLYFTLFCKPSNAQEQEYPLKEYPLQKNSESEKQVSDPPQKLTPEQRAERQSNILQKKLGLSEEQKMKAYNISFSRITKSMALIEKTNKSKRRDQKNRASENPTQKHSAATSRSRS